MKKCLIVIDMQNDFITGALGTQEAERIVKGVCARIRSAAEAGEEVLVTMDTHTDGYLETQEGKNLPVPHCVKGTEGWELCPQVRSSLPEYAVRFEKPSFGSRELFEYVQRREYDRIEFCGLCTDICVISNAMGIKAFLPEAEILVNASCCAGVTPESHQCALRSMQACQIHIIHTDERERECRNTLF